MKQNSSDVPCPVETVIDATPSLDLSMNQKVPFDLNDCFHRKPDTQNWAGAVVGTLMAIDSAGQPLVDFPHNPTGDCVPARASVTLTASQVGHEVILMFENCNPQNPLILGVLQSPHPSTADESADHGEKQIGVSVDGGKLTLTAEREIVLQCGDARIVLDRTGKVLIRGKHLVSRAAGVNRIKGGAVQIN